MFGESKEVKSVDDHPHLPPVHSITMNSGISPEQQQRQLHCEPDNNRATNLCYDLQKNKPQSNSASGAYMVMLVSGIHIGWGICSPQIRLQEWHINTYPHEYTLVILSWYLGAVLGSLLTLYIYTKFTKRQIYYFAGALCAISSALFIGLSGNAVALIIARALAGIAHGFAYITGICHASENSVKEYRGILISYFHYCIILSAFIVTVILPLEGDPQAHTFDYNMLLGGMCLLYSVLGLAFVPCLTFESIVYLIQRLMYREAITNMIKLRSESQETWEIKNDFDEMKLMVAEDLRAKRSILKDGNTRPLILIVLTKFVTALGFNYALNMIRMEGVDPLTTAMWSPTTLLAIRVIVMSICIFLVDTLGRKKLFGVSTLGAGISLIVYGIVHTMTDYAAIGRSIPIFAFEVLASIGMLNIPDVLMSEAFPIKKKILSITLASLTEHALQILIIGLTYQMSVESYVVPVVFTFGAILVTLAVFLYTNLPETRVMSLRQARSEFRKKYDEVTFNREQLPPHLNNYS